MTNVIAIQQNGKIKLTWTYEPPDESFWLDFEVTATPGKNTTSIEIIPAKPVEVTESGAGYVDISDLDPSTDYEFNYPTDLGLSSDKLSNLMNKAKRGSGE
jgi:hypothetical protein